MATAFELQPIRFLPVGLPGLVGPPPLVNAGPCLLEGGLGSGAAFCPDQTLALEVALRCCVIECIRVYQGYFW
ncbi:hypothetical protein Pyn_18319 [Prunus yedoensis var. nudiflora]|uniref:Uncharacterized protein n=1 Tax=Prunus yedoensis var. nudiflora TaxID=2094558 RepID=A0A314Z9L3_PRUYE|nr:hypothetical protein Pyn_18319 [Prunus yedoensis var. nudiflora]